MRLNYWANDNLLHRVHVGWVGGGSETIRQTSRILCSFAPSFALRCMRACAVRGDAIAFSLSFVASEVRMIQGAFGFFAAFDDRRTAPEINDGTDRDDDGRRRRGEERGVGEEEGNRFHLGHSSHLQRSAIQIGKPQLSLNISYICHCSVQIEDRYSGTIGTPLYLR